MVEGCSTGQEISFLNSVTGQNQKTRSYPTSFLCDFVSQHLCFSRFLDVDSVLPGIYVVTIAITCFTQISEFSQFVHANSLIQNECEVTFYVFNAFFLLFVFSVASAALNKILQSHLFGYNPKETVLEAVLEGLLECG